MVIVDSDVAEEQLVGGLVVCPCAGTLAPWGWARSRVVVGVGRLRPRRGRCRACGATHVLGDSRCLERRAYGVQTVGSALEDGAAGAGFRAAARRLGVPASTVRDWFRRARANAAVLVVVLVQVVVAADPGAVLPSGAGLAGLVDAVGAAASAVVRRAGPGVVVSPWGWVCRASRGRLLWPGLTAG